MAATQHRLEFAPVPAPGGFSSMALALLVHGLLLAALAWGVRWHHELPRVAVEAELWSSVVQQAAPAPQPEPPPLEPVAKVVTPEPPQAARADIVLQRERAQRLERQRHEQELAAQAKLERDKARKLADDKRLADEALRRKEAEKLAQANNKAQQDKAAAKALEKQRQENLARMAALAGAAGSSSTGTAAQSSGPSGGYSARVTAAVRPKIVFTEDIAGNPTAEVEVRCAPDGSIVGRKLLKSSGSKAWDEAVLKAIDKTERLPRDADGRVFPSLVIAFRPKD